MTTAALRRKHINDIILTSGERVRRLRGSHDQFTGKGMEMHTHRYAIPDYASLPVQWLTDEVYNNPFYVEVRRAGTIKKYVEQMNTEHPDVFITQEDVEHQLMMTRIERDPSFAFYVIFEIKYKRGGVGPFILNYPQRIVLTELEQMRGEGIPIRIILLKARQWGGSTLVQLYIAWIQLFVVEHWYSVIIAQTKDTSKRIKAMYRKVLEAIPGFVFNADKIQFSPYEGTASDSIITDSAGHILRDSVITTASYENYDTTRGQDYALAHFSEVAYWRPTLSKTADEVIRAIEGNILEEPNTIEVAESTARGMSGWFYDEYQLAKAGKSARRAIFIPFFYIENDMLFFASASEKRKFAEWLYDNRLSEVEPDKTAESGKYLYELYLKGASLEHIKWYIHKRRTFHSHAQMASEAPADDVECFMYSGNLVFSMAVIEDQRERHVSQPIYVGDIVGETKQAPRLASPDPNGLLRIWRQPDTRRNISDRYLVVVDVGGRSQYADYNVITVVDRWPVAFGGAPEVVARWRGHMRYDYLAYKAVALARYYCNALLVFESNTFDKKRAESTEFVEQGDHIRGILEKVRDSYKNLYMRKATDPEDIKQGILQKVGFNTNVKTKQDMVDNFIVEFEDGRWIDHDERFYAEAAIYEQRENGSYGNIPGTDNHDDIIMTDMIGSLISVRLPLPKVVRSKAREEEPLGTINESLF